MIAPATQLRLADGLVAGEETDPNQSSAAPCATRCGVHLSIPAEFCKGTFGVSPWPECASRTPEAQFVRVTLMMMQHLLLLCDVVMQRTPCRGPRGHPCCKQPSAQYTPTHRLHGVTMRRLAGERCFATAPCF